MNPIKLNKSNNNFVLDDSGYDIIDSKMLLKSR